MMFSAGMNINSYTVRFGAPAPEEPAPDAKPTTTPVPDLPAQGATT